MARSRKLLEAAKVTYSASNTKSVRVTKDARTPGVQPSRDELKQLLKSVVDLEAYIPASLVDAIGEKIATGELTPLLPGRARQPRPGQFTNDKAVAEEITQPISQITRAYYAYYVAMLKAMDEVLRNPNVPVRVRAARKKYGVRTINGIDTGYARETVAFQRVVNLVVSDIGQDKTTALTLSGKWKGLEESTIEAKQELGYSPTFWKHEGEGYQAFHSEMMSRLSRLKPRNFKSTIVRKYVSYGQRDPRVKTNGVVSRIRSARFEVQIGVPAWNKKMDTITTLPFATGDLGISTLASTGLRQGQKKLRGINRILAAEATRPWLRLLAAKAGIALEKHLQGMGTGAAPGRSPLARSMRAAENQQRMEQSRSALEKSWMQAMDRRADALQAERVAENRRMVRESDRRAAAAFKEYTGRTPTQMRRLLNSREFNQAVTEMKGASEGRAAVRGNGRAKTKTPVQRAKSTTPVKQNKAKTKSQSKPKAKTAQPKKQTSISIRRVDLRAMRQYDPNNFELRMATIKRSK